MSSFPDRQREHAYGRHAPMPPRVSSWTTAAGSFARTLLVWSDRARQRRQLLALGDRALHDIGIGRAEAAGEGDKPFWRA